MRNHWTIGLLPAFIFTLGASGSAQHWTQVNADGFGSPANGGAALVSYAGDLYAATANASGSKVLRYDGSAWLFEKSLGANNAGVFDPTVFAGLLYLGTYNEVTGCEVWRYDATLDTWTRVDPGGGFGDTMNNEVTGMGVYNGLLYVGTQHVTTGGVCTGAEVWSYSPTAPVPWQQLGVPWATSTCEADGFVEHEGRLFAGVTDETNGCEVWSYDGASWRLEASGGFGDAAAQADARGMAVCGGSLFVGTENSATGCEVWRYDGAPSSWTRVANLGFGLGPQENEEVLSLGCFGGSVFAGTEGTGSVWRYDSGTAWTQVNTSGFGDVNNAIAGSLVEHQGRLYAGTLNESPPGTGAEVWRHEIFPYGCASPEHSLLILGGTPTQGSLLTFGVDEPTGAASSPSFAFLAVALAADASLPCGTVLPGLGELLISVAPPNPVLVLPATSAWTTPGNPVLVNVPVPVDPTLASLSVYLQAALVGTAGTPIRLTEGFHLVIQ